MYALVDCNNFFVSCERAFQPQLEGKAVVVLSNNDGCVVARSNESKALGIKMGTPLFQLRNLVESGALTVRSSNYSLYGDMSSRVMTILRRAVPSIEIYSIDEAFLNLEGLPETQFVPLCSALVKEVRCWTGIPVSIGIAPTKTLGKLASHFAKRYKGYRGVCFIDSEVKRDKALSLTPIGDVWGIGWRSAPKLASMGVATAADFAGKPEEWVRKHLGIGGVRTWQELHGVCAVTAEDNDRRQSICTSRSFADMITDREELELRVSDFAGICAQKLRKEGSVAGRVVVFIHTNRFREDLKQYYPFAETGLEPATGSTPEIVGAALKAFRSIYRPDFKYKRAGVIVDDIRDTGYMQASLFSTKEDLEYREKTGKISELMDKINTPGHNTLRLATQRAGHYADGIRREHCSSLFSTDWDQLLEIH